MTILHEWFERHERRWGSRTVFDYRCRRCRLEILGLTPVDFQARVREIPLTCDEQYVINILSK